MYDRVREEESLNRCESFSSKRRLNPSTPTKHTVQGWFHWFCLSFPMLLSQVTTGLAACKNVHLGAGKVPQWLNWLPQEQEDLSLDPRRPHEAGHIKRCEWSCGETGGGKQRISGSLKDRHSRYSNTQQAVPVMDMVEGRTNTRGHPLSSI